MKRAKKSTDPPHYVDILLPKNTPLGIYIGGFAFLAGFGLVWHMYWLAVIGVVGVVTTLLIRFSDDDTEYVVPAAQIAALEAASPRRVV
jgi:cytochrome o ubiquinol oxidase subunit 1